MSDTTSNKNIVIQDICKSYGQNQVVKNLNLEVTPGERLILLGPSGCGKSTTLRMVAGLEDITSGRLLLGGRPANHLPSGKREVSMVFQNYALYPHMTVADNITYSLRVKKLPRAEVRARLEGAVKMLELEGLERRKPKDLSGGQRQRVALARAIVKRSDYLLLDEPLSNLDAQLRQHARGELIKIHGEFGQTVVYVTHDQIEAMTVGHRIALLHQGVLQMLDTPQNVYNRPANVFTAKFIGSPCCNVVQVGHEGKVLHFGGQELVLPERWAEIACSRQSCGSLYFGIRPEHLRLERSPRPGGLRAVVKYVEDYGNRLGIYLDLEGRELMATCPTGAPQPGESVYLRPDLGRIHLFDAETTDSLGYPQARMESEYRHEAVVEFKFA